MNETGHTCPECGEEVQICDRCGELMHEDSVTIYMSDEVFCGTCDRKRLGRCMRMRMPDEITGVPV